MPIEEYVFLSGKGGSGKTTVCAAWAQLSGESNGGRQPVVVDADVEAANLELLSRSRRQEEHVFVGNSQPVIDSSGCTVCGRCLEVCRFEAVTIIENRDGQRAIPRIDPILCEGCGACREACPTGSVEMVPRRSGSWFRSESRFGPLFHAALLPGGENSGKLVARVRKEARHLAETQGLDYIISDGPPGIGCPVISSLSGANLAILVTEPTLSGIHDLVRVLGVCRHFDVPATVCINKCDLNEANRRQIEEYCSSEGIAIASRIPFDNVVTEALAHSVPVVEYSRGQVSREIEKLWHSVSGTLEHDEKE